MGGCASKPKELTETNPDAAPIEEPVKAEETVAAKAETTADDDKKDSSGSDDKSKDEAPLVDLSKPDEDEKKETKAAEAVPVLVLPGESIVVENPKGETVEVEVAAKEGEIIYVEAVKETKKEEEKEKKEAQEEPKTAPPATSEDKKEELLVKNKKERKRVREVGILNKDPETPKEQIDKLNKQNFIRNLIERKH